MKTTKSNKQHSNSLKSLTAYAQDVFGHKNVRVEKCIGYDQNKPNAKFAIYEEWMNGDSEPRVMLNAREIRFDTKLDVLVYLKKKAIIDTSISESRDDWKAAATALFEDYSFTPILKLMEQAEKMRSKQNLNTTV